MHLDEEQVQRLLDGELAPSAAAAAREHMAGCDDCDRRVAEAVHEEREMQSLLRSLDHPPPRVSAEAVMAKTVPRDFGRFRWAAGILVSLGIAGAAYTAPGSPFPAWIDRAAHWIQGRPDPAPIAPAPPPSPDPIPDVAGIAVVPGRELVILFASRQVEGRARVSLTDGSEVVVRAPIGAATFTSDARRLVIENQGPAAFDIQIPRNAQRVEIRVDGVLAFLKEGARVTTSASTDPRGPWFLPLGP